MNSMREYGKAMLLFNKSLGGAERRYARCFVEMSHRDDRLFLFTNPELYEQAVAAGVELQQSKNVKIFDMNPVSARLFKGRVDYVQKGKWAKVFNLLLFFTHKIDILAFFLSLRHAVEKMDIALVHLILIAVHKGFPFCFWKKTIVSVMNPELKEMATARVLGIDVGYYAYLLALRKCDTIDALSPGIRHKLVQSGVDRNKIQTAPCSFIDYTRFRPSEDKKDWVVFAARLVDVKNPLLFVKAIPLILEVEPSLQFFILGQGPLEKDVRDMIGRSNIQSSVTLRYEPDISATLSLSKVFASVQRYENYPSQSMLEAMACGNAVVATDVGETWRLVDETVGILVPPDPRQVAEAVIYLFRNPQLLTSLGYNARQKVLKEHTKAKFVSYMAEVYDSTLNQSPADHCESW